MKKTIIIIASVMMIIIFVVVSFFLYRNSLLHNCSVSSAGVDNNYNNSKVNGNSKLIMVNDKLYYNYLNGDIVNCGTYKICPEESKRVYSEGIQLSPKGLTLDNIIDNKIYLDVNADLFFDTNNDKLSFGENKAFVNNVYSVPFVVNNTLYFAEDTKIYKSEDNHTYKLLVDISKAGVNNISFDGLDFYLTDKYIYYQAWEDSDCWLYQYNITEKQITGKVDLKKITNSDNGADCIIADEKDVFININNNSIYHYNFENNISEQIFSTDGVLCFNLFNKKLYIGLSDGEHGLYEIDLIKSSKKQLINNININEIYILDTDYIYFIDSNDKLYRIYGNNNHIESVFG